MDFRSAESLAMDVETGVISPGGVGYDINCGVRLALLPDTFFPIRRKGERGVDPGDFRPDPYRCRSRTQRVERKLTDSDYRDLLEKGARWSIEQGYGFQEDLEHMESRGCIEGANLDAVSTDGTRSGDGVNWAPSVPGTTLLKSGQSRRFFYRILQRIGAFSKDRPMF